jgi:hypothetical protein
MTWERGRAEIERLLAAGELERVGASPDVAERLAADTVRFNPYEPPHLGQHSAPVRF